MVLATSKIDISENTLRSKGDVLDILLLDRTTSVKHKQNTIIWATDSYMKCGNGYSSNNSISRDLITGIKDKIIQPRATKSLEERIARTKDKAEVFTPLKIVKQMNLAIDEESNNFPVAPNNWIDYIKELRLEITCGEAPFIVSRYDPTSHSEVTLDLKDRVGFLDSKLKVVSEHCVLEEEWLQWAKVAFQSSYGYEWQGDNLLIARENLLYSLIDYYLDKFGKEPSIDIQQEFAEIISWNIFQMDGLKYVIPMSCHHETKIIRGDLSLFGETPDKVEKNECEGCKFNRPGKHNGKYVKIMDWVKGKPIKFIKLLQ